MKRLALALALLAAGCATTRQPPAAKASGPVVQQSPVEVTHGADGTSFGTTISF
jgi:hypothetical protein